jgi:hypothetical protein
MKGGRERVWLYAFIGLVLVVGIWSAFFLGPTSPPNKAATLAAGLSPANVPVCHAIPGIPGAAGQVGPKLVLGTTGTLRLADPAYRGGATTVREYVMESILAPGLYVVPGFPDRAMPRWYGQKLSASALDKMAAYLEGITEAESVSGK